MWEYVVVVFYIERRLKWDKIVFLCKHVQNGLKKQNKTIAKNFILESGFQNGVNV